jgi:hypothetical protein
MMPRHPSVPNLIEGIMNEEKYTRTQAPANSRIGLRGGCGSILPRCKFETCNFGECSEVLISRQEGNALIDTALRYQGVSEARFASLCKNF